jgi:hypothetical protein
MCQIDELYAIWLSGVRYTFSMTPGSVMGCEGISSYERTVGAPCIIFVRNFGAFQRKAGEDQAASSRVLPIGDLILRRESA